MRRLSPARSLIGAFLAFAACASPGAPPGGPIDTNAPQLIAVAPESGAVRVSPRAVLFRFDEVVSERPPAVPSLTNLFVISPQEGTPVVDWSRSEISVRPRRGWRPNTTYTVTMLPGVADLRGNVSREQHVVVFSTGAEIPQTRIAGRAFDWPAGTVAGGALVQAITPDSVIYSAVADSAGVYSLLHMPPGQYFLQAMLDENRNRALDPRERFDSVTVAVTDTLTRDFLLFVQDSIPPRLASVQVLDSVSLQLNFDLPLNPEQVYAQFSVRGPDSVVVREYSLITDTSRVQMPRPMPPRAVRLTVSPLRLDAAWVAHAIGVAGLTGINAPSERSFRTPAEWPAPPARAPVPGDTVPPRQTPQP